MGKLGWKDLLEIAHADIRKIHEESLRSDSFDSYLGIQRELSPSRISEISEYFRTQDATFPTSIILSIKSSSIISKQIDVGLKNEYADNEQDNEIVSNVIIDEQKQIIKIRKVKEIASILDGQHRIEGLREGFENYLFTEDFEFNITLFIDMDIDDQAQVFSVINKAQTKVNKSLVYDLYEFTKVNSPQKTAHDIVRILNKNDKSPFFRKVKILGVANDKDRETIAQATLAELIIDYITASPIVDRDLIRRKKNVPIKKAGLSYSTKDEERRIFRSMFINENNEYIINVLWMYFSAVKKRWPRAWDDSSLLSKSTGVIAFMRFLRPLFISLGSRWDITENEYYSVLSRSTLKDSDFTKEKFIPGTSGQSKLYHLLVQECIANGKPGFVPE